MAKKEKPNEVTQPDETKSMGLGDSSEVERPRDQPAVASPRARQGDDTKPYCPRHNVLLRATGSRELHTNYACPVQGCQTREKRIRPSLKVPSEPQMCPQRTCRDADGVALEVDERLSNLAHLHMSCPQCGFHLKMPRPQFDAAAAARERRRETQDLSER
jgi:hypothetical protein